MAQTQAENRREKDHRGGRRFRGGDKRERGSEEVWNRQTVQSKGGFRGDIEGVGERGRERWSLRSSLGAVTGRIRQRCDSLGRRDADEMDDKL